MNEIIRCLCERRSCRSYAETQVEEEKLQQILKAGTYAASGMGRQPAKIVVLQKKEDIEALETLNAAIMGRPGTHPFYGAPTVCIVLTKADVYTGVEDASLVMGNLMNAAHSLGVDSCWIHRAKEEFESAEGKKMLEKWGIEGDWRGVGHCILGYANAENRPAAERKEDYIVRI